MTRINELLELRDAVSAWRDAVCSWPQHPMMSDTDRCDGDNHLMECPVERARQDLITLHNRLR